MQGFSIDDIEATINATVTSAAWIARKGHQELAIEMRDEFCVEWCVAPQEWNKRIDDLRDYVRRKGETPHISERHLMAVRY